jgi:hypothetical protein
MASAETGLPDLRVLFIQLDGIRSQAPALPKVEAKAHLI